MRKREYKYITIWEDAEHEDILFNVYSSRLDIDINIARELIENRLEFANGQSVYVIVDFTNVKSVTKEARDFMNSDQGGLNGILAGAFLSNNVVATLFVNLYLRVSNPKIPARLFTSKVEALKWLKKIRAEHKQRATVL